MNRYIADWHYGHSNVIAYDNRPFADVDTMNKALIKLWNDTVSKNDTVYILGDMFWKYGEAAHVMDELHGDKVLIKGNHDRLKPVEYVNRFAGVYDYLEVEDEKKHIICCHYPIPCFKNHTRENWYHFYGHVHNSFESNMMEHDRFLMEELYEQECRMYNVGAMMPYIKYAPRTANEIILAYGLIPQEDRFFHDRPCADFRSVIQSKTGKW